MKALALLLGFVLALALFFIMWTLLMDKIFNEEEDQNPKP